jgi:hypothetical protein
MENEKRFMMMSDTNFSEDGTVDVEKNPETIEQAQLVIKELKGRMDNLKKFANNAVMWVSTLVSITALMARSQNGEVKSKVADELKAINTLTQVYEYNSQVQLPDFSDGADAKQVTLKGVDGKDFTMMIVNPGQGHDTKLQNEVKSLNQEVSIKIDEALAEAGKIVK